LNSTPDNHSRRHRGSIAPNSEAFAETQTNLFEKGIGGCRYRPCTSAVDDSVGLQQKCDTAVWPSVCYDRIKWVLYQGIPTHPEWYPNLNKFSSPKEVQKELVSLGRKSCLEPCPSVLDPSVQDAFTAIADAESSVCATFVPIPHLHSPVFEFSDEDDWACFNELVRTGFAAGGYRKTRKWCWVGIKEFGCHEHWPDRLTWRQMADDAARKAIAVPRGFSPLTNAQVCDQQVLGGLVDWSRKDLTQAKVWFDKNVAVYVLSLPSSTARRAAATECMTQAFVQFEFVDGVDVRQPNAIESAKQEGLIPDSYNFQYAQEEAYKQGMGKFGSISGTLGCASGHFRAQLQGKKSLPSKPLSLVFEDDICPSTDLIPRLWRLVHQELPCDWQVMSLRSMCPLGHCISPHLTRVLPDINEPMSRCHHSGNYGFFGMLYRMDEIESVQKAMKSVVFNETHPMCLDVDVALAAVSDEVRYYGVPSSHDPGFLRELPEGSNRVSINFQVR